MLRTLLAGALVVACASAASIVEIAAAKGAPFTSLVSLLNGANLTETLAGKGPFTVFAPTDDAFQKLTAIPPPDVVKKILLSHVVAGTVKAADLKDGQLVETLSGAKVPVSILNGTIRVGGSKVTTADVAADNGVVHIIDTVIVPKEVLPAAPAPAANLPATVVDIAAGNKDFTTLVELVTKAGLAGVLADKKKQFTVFAPTNDAFKQLKAVPKGDALKNVLLSHVVEGIVRAADLEDGQMVETLSGAKVPVSIINGTIRVGGSKVTTADGKAQNGVVHIIDAVILPTANSTTPTTSSAAVPSKPKPTAAPKPTSGKPATVVDVAVGNKDFSTLVNLVTKAGLAGVLADKEKQFTVFAPTNAAFKELKAVPEGDALKNVLLYHVVDNFKKLRGNGQTFTTLNGQKVNISGSHGNFKVNGAKVVGQVKAKNGYVYIIDKVLLPK